MARRSTMGQTDLEGYLLSLMRRVWALSLKWQARNPGLLICDDKYAPEEGGGESWSQYGQDLFCFYKVFKAAGEGVFVDVGANHPRLLNNTCYLEQKGWRGLAFEPQENLRELWAAQRKTRCLPYVLGRENRTVNFIGTADPAGQVLAGVEGFNKLSPSLAAAPEPRAQRRLDEVLLEHGLSRVDYLSIDVEGYELDVLLGLDLSKIDVKCIDIENDIGTPYLGNSALRRRLLASGYRQVARLGGDDIFVKKGAALPG